MAECTYCPFQQIVNAVSALTKTYRVIPSAKDAAKYNIRPGDTVTLDAIQYTAYKLKKNKVKKVAMDVHESYLRVVSAIESQLMPLMQKVCLECSKASNDDNLSRKGQTFVFLEAMCTNGLSGKSAIPGEGMDEPQDGWDGTTGGTGESLREDSESDPFFTDADGDYAEPDNRQTSSDWLHKNVKIDTHYLDPEGCTKLPSHIEDHLRKILHSFSQLSVFEQNLIFSQLSGQTFSDFGSMSWIPSDMRKPQSKQLVSVRWDKLVRKFPLAAALRGAKVVKEIQRTRNERSKHYAEKVYEQESLDFGDSF